MVVESLACSVAPPILAHFLRNLSSGRRGVALVRHGVCSECHIQVPSSVMYALVQPHDLHLCDHCGCYLLLPEDEIPRLTRETKKSPRRPASADQTVAT